MDFPSSHLKFYPMTQRIILFFLCVAVFAQCSEDQEEKCELIPDVSAIALTLNFEQLEDSLPNVQSKKQLVGFLTNHPEIRDVFFNRKAYPDDSVFINSLYARFTNPAIDTLLMETHRVFGDGSELKNEFQTAFTNLKYYYPDFQPPKIQFVITGLESDVFVSDSLVIVGLDYFLGPGAKYKLNMYEYMQRRYQKNFIVPSVLLLYGIDSRFNKTDLKESNVLADMVSYGKAYSFAKHMLPCVPDSILIGYTREEIEGSRENESLIWSRLIEDQVLYATSHLVKQRFIDERPKTIEVGEKCPGRIGTWVGWQMIREYEESHPDVILPQIMNLPNPEKIFKDSGYKPQIVQLKKAEKV
jgi:hypothetical protein